MVQPYVSQKGTDAMRIDVISDTVCPWCFIGKRRLEAALEMFADRPDAVPVDVRWHPFQLNPAMPREGADRAGYLAAKFGGPERAAQIYGRIRAAGAEVGLDLDPERAKVMPNTLDSHRLLHRMQMRDETLSDGAGRGDRTAEALFRAFFGQGRDIGDPAVLAEIARAVDPADSGAAAYLATDEDRDMLAAADAHAREIGIDGVPCFIIDGRWAVMGAQAPEQMLAALVRAATNTTAGGVDDSGDDAMSEDGQSC
ncbi:DsbA family oxidoreductase [Tistrella bauzanensis]|uniref:DsbA family oxidoreductase n=1 Tax=Tistrella arctica TaxID=3133430 RepID=A0ABU9YIP0_9PROT